MSQDDAKLLGILPQGLNLVARPFGFLPHVGNWVLIRVAEEGIEEERQYPIFELGGQQPLRALVQCRTRTRRYRPLDRLIMGGLAVRQHGARTGRWPRDTYRIGGASRQDRNKGAGSSDEMLGMRH